MRKYVLSNWTILYWPNIASSLFCFVRLDRSIAKLIMILSISLRSQIRSSPKSKSRIQWRNSSSMKFKSQERKHNQERSNFHKTSLHYNHKTSTKTSIKKKTQPWKKKFKPHFTLRRQNQRNRNGKIIINISKILG